MWMRPCPDPACWEVRLYGDCGWATYFARPVAIDADGLTVDVAETCEETPHRCEFSAGRWACPCGARECERLKAAAAVRRHFLAFRECLCRLAEGDRAAFVAESFTEEES